MTKPKISILVPCYKVEQYLPKCLDSLMHQTLKDIEVICINDASPDNCLKILKNYRKKYGAKIVIVDKKKNGGLGAARQDGLAVAKGEYIGCVDSDDYVHKDFAKKLYQAAKAHDADIAVCGFDRVDLDTGKLYSREMCKPRHQTIDIRQDPGALLEVNNAVWNKLYRTELLKQMYQLKNAPIIFEDVALMLPVLVNARKITLIPDSLVYYMVRQDSIINTVKPEFIPSTYAFMKEIRDLYTREAPELLDYLDANAFLNLGVSLMYRISTAQDVDFPKILRDNTKFLNENFPRWRKTEYTTLCYVLKNRGTNGKLWVVKCFYNLGLFRMFLKTYNFMIEKLGVDIKW